MADFAKWVVAAEPALGWRPGTFLNAYSENREAAVETFLESHVVGVAVSNLIGERLEWTGTATDLLRELQDHSEDSKANPVWPKTPRGLSGQLRRASPALRLVGVEVTFPGRRQILIRKKTETTVKTDTTAGTATPGDGWDGPDGSVPNFSGDSDADVVLEQEAIQLELGTHRSGEHD